jgi:serine/threonine protein kinase
MGDEDLQHDGAGQRLGRYVLVRRLGKGGMGEVFLARTQGARGFEKHVAIKRILPQYSQNQHVVNMLVDEARISVLLNHPNVVQVMELDEDDGNHFIVMEYVDGHALSRLIRRLKKRGERFDPLLACYVVIQVLEGLHAAHTQRDASGELAGIIHRDVSPQNVLLSMTGQVKVIDFGIARARDRLEATQGSQVKGKLRYMAPEQIKPSLAGSGGIDHRVDVFAAGIMLFELLAMRQRFPQTGDIEIIDAILETDVPDLEKEGLVDRELMDILRTALARDRKRRFKDAAAYAAALRAYLYARDPSFNGERLARTMRKCFLEEAPDAAADDVDDAPAPAPVKQGRVKVAAVAEPEPDEVTRTQFRPQRPPPSPSPSPEPASPGVTGQRAPATRRRGIPAPVLGAALGAIVLVVVGVVVRGAMQPKQLSPDTVPVTATSPTTTTPTTSPTTTTPTPTPGPPTPVTAPPPPPPAADGSVEVVVEVVPASATITRAYQPDPKFVSPARFRVQPGETLDLQFEAVGFQPLRQKFVVEGTAPRVQVQLEPIPMPVIVRPVPRDAEVTVNGQPYRNSRTTVTPGEQVVIRATHPFYFDVERTVLATPGLQQLVVDLTLEERPVPTQDPPGTPSSPSSAATLSLTSSPSGADVFVDGLKLGRTPVDLRVAPGPHRVTVRGKEAESTFAITVGGGDQLKRHIALE